MPSETSHSVRPGLAPQEHASTRMVALSFDGPSSPSVTLKGLQRPNRGQPFGWGFAWYPVQSAAALVVKDATSLGDNAMTKLLREWERFRSTIFVSHLRGTARTLAEQDTHPFSRSFGGREWVFAHNGDFDGFDIDQGINSVLPLASSVIIPVGRTDSERAFCWLLEQCAAIGAYSLADVGWPRLHEWCRYLDGLGTANLMLTDGHDLAVYGDSSGYNRLHHGRLLPPNVPALIQTEDVDIGLSDARDRTRTAVIFSTSQPEETKLKPMHDGQLLVVRRGAYIFDSHASPNDLKLMVSPLPSVDVALLPTAGPAQRPAGLQAAAHGDNTGISNELPVPNPKDPLPNAEGSLPNAEDPVLTAGPGESVLS
ncbi:MAG: class II glutamine amidotransferase, partial [Myxococcota bacterium]